LPYKSGQSFEVIQGENGTFSHFDELLYSIDFQMPEGTEVIAMRDGTVLFIKEDSNENGSDPSFKEKSNYIWVLHDDGSIASYAHIRQNGSVVEAGDKVKAGDLLGYSGNTGYSTIPHLHVQVFLYKGFSPTEYIPIRFNGIDGALIEGSFYRAVTLTQSQSVLQI
jgi:murein DD-endopeptidase MepM/ murein hydrolase activator NlpD